MENASSIDVLLFDLGGVVIDFAGFDELSHLLPGGVSRDEVRERWISSPFVQRFERDGLRRHRCSGLNAPRSRRMLSLGEWSGSFSLIFRRTSSSTHLSGGRVGRTQARRSSSNDFRVDVGWPV